MIRRYGIAFRVLLAIADSATAVALLVLVLALRFGSAFVRVGGRLPVHGSADRDRRVRRALALRAVDAGALSTPGAVDGPRRDRRHRPRGGDLRRHHPQPPLRVQERGRQPPRPVRPLPAPGDGRAADPPAASTRPDRAAPAGSQHPVHAGPRHDTAQPGLRRPRRGPPDARPAGHRTPRRRRRTTLRHHPADARDARSDRGRPPRPRRRRGGDLPRLRRIVTDRRPRSPVRGGRQDRADPDVPPRPRDRGGQGGGIRRCPDLLHPRRARTASRACSPNAPSTSSGARSSRSS